MTGIMIGLGVWGVLAASQQYSNDKQNQAQVSEQGVKKLRQRAKGGGGAGESKCKLQSRGRGLGRRDLGYGSQGSAPQANSRNELGRADDGKCIVIAPLKVRDAPRTLPRKHKSSPKLGKADQDE